MRASATTSTRRQRRGDSAGLMLSGLCLLHCLAAPALVAVVPALALGMNHEVDRAVHAVLLLLALPISLWTFRQGLNSHGQLRWLGVGVAGLVLMLAGVLLHTPSHSEMWLTVAGVALLAGAHVMNWLATTSAAGCGTPSAGRCNGPAPIRNESPSEPVRRAA